MGNAGSRSEEMLQLTLVNTNDVPPEAECADNKTSLSAVSEADVEGSAVAGLARFTGLKKEDMEEGQAVAGSAGVIGTACLTGLKNE
ncbi:hypothetical protein E2C01_034567 [Portunus trituberculatus]|uniref:Uncharacterized protein n=1 Tax=Portunus trituberculatus TaxID=210409 RepID=A0A5B7F7A5_PORTR|nr:hypothetical protein [Portunus trituberculatus]